MAGTAVIVENDPDTAQLLATCLRDMDFDPAILATGGPAVPWVRRHHPELILLDPVLPDVDGHGICRELKLDRHTNLIPLILVSARSHQDDRVRGLAVGANGHVTRPFTEKEIRRAVAQGMAWRADLRRQGTEGEIRFQLCSAPQYLEELNQLLASLFLFTPLSELQVSHLMLAVRELGTNAIEWGHRNQVERLVTVTYRIDPHKVSIVIGDSGPGFNPGEVPHAARPEDPLAHLAVREALGLRDGGCGILMARGLVDDLQYNAAGNEVRLVKYFSLEDRRPGRGPAAPPGTVDG
jgi:CheY-like chemotaxis protein/anti-sigma regulatory factor (Ser/Thr protein kinase)